jgi:hypothetical protein
LHINDRGELDMTQIDNIRSTYSSLIDQEADAKGKLAQARSDLEDVKAADVAAFADAALAGEPAPKRKEIRLLHTIENLTVALAGFDEAHARLLDEAITAVGEGRDRQLDRDEQQHLRSFFIPKLTDEARRDAWQQSGQVASTDLRPDDLVEFVTGAYDAADARFRSDEHSRYMRSGYGRAIAAIEEAKREHRKRGHESGTFHISAYEDIVTPELQRFLSSAPSKGSPQNATKPGDEIPWPGSLQDLRDRSEPTSTPA